MISIVPGSVLQTGYARRISNMADPATDMLALQHSNDIRPMHCLVVDRSRVCYWYCGVTTVNLSSIKEMRRYHGDGSDISPFKMAPGRNNKRLDRCGCRDRGTA